MDSWRDECLVSTCSWSRIAIQESTSDQPWKDLYWALSPCRFSSRSLHMLFGKFCWAKASLKHPWPCLGMCTGRRFISKLSKVVDRECKKSQLHLFRIAVVTIYVVCLWHVTDTWNTCCISSSLIASWLHPYSCVRSGTSSVLWLHYAKIC